MEAVSLPVFADRDQLYRVLGAFFETLPDGPHGPLIHRVGGPILFVFHRPEARILWEPLAGGPPEFAVHYDTEQPEPLLRFEQDADLAHRFWQGDLDLQDALARQQIRARGPLARAMKLIPQLDPVYGAYRAFLQADGAAPA
jgi:hypothetical protein